VALVMVNDPRWHRHLEQLSPMTAGLGVQTTVDLHSLTLGPWTGVGVVALWAGVALALGAMVLQRRDA
jgi:ABC-2 type transport system permease protein